MTIQKHEFIVDALDATSVTLSPSGAVGPSETFNYTQFAEIEPGFTTSSVVEVSWDNNQTPTTPQDLVIDYLHVLKGKRLGPIAVATNTTVDLTKDAYIVDATLGDVTVTLPSSNHFAFTNLNIKKNDLTGNKVIIVPDGSELIEGETDAEITVSGTSLTLKPCDGNWLIV